MGLISLPSFYIVGREAYNTKTPRKLVDLGNYVIAGVFKRSGTSIR